MKLQKVKIENIKVLKDVDVDINGHHVLVCGENGLGKSSFIQFLEIALGKNTNIPPNATGKGEVIVNRDGEQYTFKVKIKDGKSVIEVTTPDGMKDSRKGTIAGIVGAIDFDIDEFVEMSKSEKGRKEQVKIFKSFLPEEIRQELARFEANTAANFEERTYVNKQIKELSGAIKSNPLYGVPFNKKEVDSSIQIEGTGFGEIIICGDVVSDKFIEPIPITEEWLLKFGFVRKEDYFHLNNKFFSGYAFDLKNFCLVKEYPAYGNEFHTTDIMYVHQLQNLIFALTGEELL